MRQTSSDRPHRLNVGPQGRVGLAAAVLVVGGLIPDQSVAGNIVGRVTDTSTAPVVRARVLLFDAGLTTFVEGRTRADGTYAVEAGPGDYRLGVAARDYAYVETDVTLGVGPITMDFILGPETEPGVWQTIGDTSPEQLGGSNSGSLLADGSILFCHDTRDAVRFDPVSLAKTFPPDSNLHQGCSALTLLGSGDLLFVGGQQSNDFRDSTDMVKAYNTWTDQWDDAGWPDLNLERWYPALARLADGGLLVCGGGQRPAAQRTDTCELMDPATRAWTLTDSMANPSEYSPTALLHTGEVLKTWYPPQLYDPVAGTWRMTAATVQDFDRGNVFPDHCDHSLVVLRNGEVVITGIRPDAASPDPVMAEHYDPCSETWRLGGDMVVARSRIEAAQLPDGRVFIAGGLLEDSSPVAVNAWGYVALADLYDPATGRWRPVAEMRIQREYHATTLLLPDGRVLTTAGAGSPALPSPDDGIDVYDPPYLFRGPRPSIDAISATNFAQGDTFQLDVSLAPAVTAVVMIGAQATTHYIDGAVPRRLALAFEQTGGRLDVRAPASAIAAPEGFYNVFVMVDDVPSEGVLVRLDPAAGPIPPDQIGNALRAIKALDDAYFVWRQGPLNPSRYNMYRSTSKQDMAQTMAAIGSLSPEAALDDEEWTDVGAVSAPTPLWFYQVLGRNCDGSAQLP